MQKTEKVYGHNAVQGNAWDLGNFQISDRLFAAIDNDQDNLISLEDYLVYSDILTYGTNQEKNFLTFKM